MDVCKASWDQQVISMQKIAKGPVLATKATNGVRKIERNIGDNKLLNSARQAKSLTMPTPT